MPRTCVYKMVADNGGAPCVEDNLLSLAICKPIIRKTANVGDVIFGFGAQHYEERLIYIAVVTAKLSHGDYYKFPEYRSRSDCIYELHQGQPRWIAGKRYHLGGAELEKDVGRNFERAHVLLSTDFRYFGRAKAPSMDEHPKLRDFISRLRRGHRVNFPPLVAQELQSLKVTVWQATSKPIIGRPSDVNCAALCNR